MPLRDSNDNAIEWSPVGITGEVLDSNTFFFDGGWVSEDHGASSRPTENPIATGRIVNDHLINDPATLTLVGVITDTPFAGRNSGFTGGGLLSGILEDGLTAVESALSDILYIGSKRRSADAYKILIEARQYLWTVHTSLGTYYNMACVAMGTPQNYTTGGVTVTMQLQEMLIVGSNEKLNASGLRPSHAKSSFLGNLTTNAASAATQAAIIGAGQLL